MVNLFRPKTMRRMAVFMALVAPIVYLFGSLFFALNGAHGQQVFADVDDGDRLDISLVNRLDINENGVLVNGGVNTFAESDYYHFDENLTFDVIGETNANFNIRFYFYDESHSFLTYRNLTNVRNGAVDFSNGYYVRFASYFVGESVSVRLTGFGVVSDAYLSSVGYSDYVFKHFFAQDNFLVLWGENAISESPYGFAPFGYFWRYLDTNVLHLSNEQVGLMAYGYMYYAAHVLLFDVAFMLVTFFLSFIQKVGDKIGGEER